MWDSDLLLSGRPFTNASYFHSIVIRVTYKTYPQESNWVTQLSPAMFKPGSELSNCLKRDKTYNISRADKCGLLGKSWRITFG